MASLLTVGERRRRFVHTCMKNTPYEKEMSKFDSFSAKLYQARWKEVTFFSKAVKKLRFLLQQCWSAEKYMREVDGTKFDANTLPANAEDPEAHGDGIGGDVAKFSLGRITDTIRNSFYHRFQDLVILADDTPETHIASWGAGCDCHEDLFEGRDGTMLSTHRRGRMMANHYNGAKKCIMGGKRASGFADGRIQEIISCPSN